MTNEMTLEARDLNQQAALLIKAGNTEAASKKLDKAIELDPMLVDNYKNYGDLYVALDQYVEAKQAYKKALLIEKDGFLYFLYGNACFLNNDVHEGLENYNKALSAGYDTEDMLFFMGLAYEHLNDTNTALRYFRKASLKNPSRVDFTVKQIHTLMKMQETEKADALVDELLVAAPELFDGYHIKNHILWKKGNAEEAVSFAKKASDRFPEDPDLYYDYVRSVTLTRDWGRVFSMLSIAKGMKYFEDSKRDFTFLEAQVAAETGDMDRAVLACRECINAEKEDTFDGEAHFMLMNLYMAQKDYASTREQASLLIVHEELPSFYYAALYYRAFCTQILGGRDQASKLYAEAVSLYRTATLARPADYEAYLYRAMCLRDLEQYDQAMELLDFVLDLGSDIAEIHVIKADIYRVRDMKEAASKELQLAYSLKPELEMMDPKDGE